MRDIILLQTRRQRCEYLCTGDEGRHLERCRQLIPVRQSLGLLGEWEGRQAHNASVPAAGGHEHIA